MWPRRVLRATGIALASINIWTGAPVAALWIGSRVQGSSGTTLLGVFTVALLMTVFCLGMVWVLGRLNEAYDRATGAPPKPRQQGPECARCAASAPPTSSAATR